MRIKLQIPNTKLLSTEIQVRSTDMNYANHLGNDRILAYAQELRSAWFSLLGFSELDIDGCNIVLADAAIQFQAEAFAGEVLTGVLFLGEQNKYGFDLYYQFTNQSGESVATAKTAVLFRGPSGLCAPPDSFLNKL
ncbi:acyl-CoA thioesterase [Bermanella marisrubri]|uniref:Thioesterase n=1 Tax=Bermanella marisrubri TaxID=207949 RepID=Q1N4X4_9GAMM|nr:acyl-CoA thioesterase [Bermanella marisrubri]EAT13304.1 hypothetical protein RED65_01050 [Oceanobacter sp. RED65] [Bermanella marisrubri]QIZ84066.1 acyl-CoA thioesterase [Bermanella marisrubri]